MATDSELALKAAWPSLTPRIAACIAAAWTAALLTFNLVAHQTPYYGVETDLVGEYLPAARELSTGTLDPKRYTFKGPGYPLIVAGASYAFGRDVEIAARVVSPVAIGFAGWLVFLLVSETVGGALATFAFLAFLCLPEVVRYAIEAGTDAPALALMLAATYLVLCRRGWRSMALAGTVSGLAILTRSNAAFLCVAGLPIIAVRRTRIGPIGAYLGALVAPLAAWLCAGQLAGGLPPDRNYLNVAWELYGRGIPWAQFEQTTGSHFHSLAGVFMFAPVRSLGVVARNLVVHRWLDLHLLVPAWIGLLSAPGLILLARDRRTWGLLLHALSCAVFLAPVFYSSRFALYLAPVYVTAAGASLAWAAWVLAERFNVPASRLSPVLLLGPLLATSTAAIIATLGALRQSPTEVKFAGTTLRRADLRGERILARKPHVAWYSGLGFVPLPGGVALANLPAWAATQGARYLFFSPIEKLQSPEYGVLADSGLALPGFEQLAWQRTQAHHYFALYRLDASTADSTAFRVAYYSALRKHEAAHGREPEELVFLACEWLAAGEANEALAALDSVVRLGVDRGEVHRLRSDALVALGRWADADAACRAAMKVEPVYAWHWSRLGLVAWNAGRLDEAQKDVEQALAIEPASLEYLEMLARIEFARKEPAAAATTLERALDLAPTNARLRHMAILIWQLAGQTARAERLFAAGLAAGSSPAELSGSTTTQ